jgi:hypothetical protein
MAAPAPVPAPAAPITGTPQAAPAPAPAPAGAAPAARTPAPGTATPAAPGSPQAGPQLGHDIATPPSAPASGAPLNLNLPRARAPELPDRGSRGPLNLLPPPPERKSKLAEEIEKSAREDCRKAHADKGLLAVVPLVGDTVRDKGCKW